MAPAFDSSSIDIPQWDRKISNNIKDIEAYYQSRGGSVTRSDLGTIDMSKSGIKSSIGHGVGETKAEAFYAVHDVLEKGKVIGTENNYKNRGYDSYLIVAPAKLPTGDSYVGVVVIKNPNTNRFYTHEVVQKELKGANKAFITGSANGGLSSASKTPFKQTGTNSGIVPEGATANSYIPQSTKINKTQNTTKTGKAGTPTHRDLGADVARPLKTTDELIEQYGKTEPGMQPRVEGRDIPKATDYGPVQKGIRTSAEAHAVNDASFKEIQSAVEDGMATRYGVTNESVVESASKTIADDGLEVAFGKFATATNAEKLPKSEDIALGYRLMQEYQNKGDYKKVAEIAVDVSEMLSETGRSLQAATIIKKLTPEGRLMAVQRVANKLSKKHGIKITVDEKTAKKILEAVSEEDIFKTNKEAVTKMWDKIPLGLQYQMDAWRYMSMLMNPKTHVRNIVGNGIFIIPQMVRLFIRK